MLRKITLLSFLAFVLQSHAQTITVTVDANKILGPISPWIYGKNASLEGINAATLTIYKDANLRMLRSNNGNNATKYNWKKRLSSHPDWYNNVYTNDWDKSATALFANTSNTQGMYAFQLLGKVANNTKNNFNDWAYDQSKGGNASSNLAGGGGPVSAGGNGGLGDPNKYLQDWTADSTVGILDYWFKQLKFDSTRLQYWNMDNEPEIWSGTHDDVATSAITAEDFMQKYFAVAKAARAKYPNIKLTGPVSPNEWQWYNWNNNKVTGTDKVKYTWLEYFIKRVAEEQRASGIRLLDVIDVHYYPGTETKPDVALQLHKTWFDTKWSSPVANGVKVVANSGWSNDSTKEYLFERCNRWLAKHIGPNHGVKFGISEYGAVVDKSNANITTCWYASHLGVFANKGVEYLTGWDWYPGQYEVLNLFSNKYGTVANVATSSNEDLVSGYSSLTSAGDTLVVVLVNRDQTNSQTIGINIQNFTPSQLDVDGFQLANLPKTETFVSKNQNALQKTTFTIDGNNQISATLPKLSVTMVRIPTATPVATAIEDVSIPKIRLNLYPSPAKDKLYISFDKKSETLISVKDLFGRTLGTHENTGRTAEMNIEHLKAGCYFVQVQIGNEILTKQFVKE